MLLVSIWLLKNNYWKMTTAEYSNTHKRVIMQPSSTSNSSLKLKHNANSPYTQIYLFVIFLLLQTQCKVWLHLVSYFLP